MTDVEFLIGCPGAGKSTYAEKWRQAGALVLARDNFRDCLFGSRREYYDRFQGTNVHRTASYIVGASMFAALQSALNAEEVPWPRIIVDQTNIDYSMVKRFLHLAMYNGAVVRHVRVIVFDVPFEELAARNRERAEEHQVPWDTLQGFHDRFTARDAWFRLQLHGVIPTCQVYEDYLPEKHDPK